MSDAEKMVDPHEEVTRKMWNPLLPSPRTQPPSRQDRIQALLSALSRGEQVTGTLQREAGDLLATESPTLRQGLAEAFARDVLAEYARAAKAYPPMNSRHEAFAVLAEEVDELKEVVWKNGTKEDFRKEAIQVAAMALRALTDCR